MITQEMINVMQHLDDRKQVKDIKTTGMIQNMFLNQCKIVIGKMKDEQFEKIKKFEDVPYFYDERGKK